MARRYRIKQPTISMSLKRAKKRNNEGDRVSNPITLKLTATAEDPHTSVKATLVVSSNGLCVQGTVWAMLGCRCTSAPSAIGAQFSLLLVPCTPFCCRSGSGLRRATMRTGAWGCALVGKGCMSASLSRDHADTARLHPCTSSTQVTPRGLDEFRPQLQVGRGEVLQVVGVQQGAGGERWEG